MRIKVQAGGTCEVKCLRLFQSLYDDNIFSEECILKFDLLSTPFSKSFNKTYAVLVFLFGIQG